VPVPQDEFAIGRRAARPAALLPHYQLGSFTMHCSRLGYASAVYIALALAGGLAVFEPGAVGAQTITTPILVAQGPKTVQASGDQAQKDRINTWTVGLAAGRLEGAPILFASELARVLDDGDNMRVLPIVTRGPFDNVYDLLYLRGVDAAIVYGDVLDHFKTKPEFANAWRRINFLVNLFPSEAHLFVRPEIASLQDLAGKVVNFNTQGTAAAYSGPIVFKQLGIDVKATFIPHSVAMEKMKQGEEVAATFWISSKPLAPFLKGNFPAGFKFLPIEYSDKLEYYAPAYLEHADYPALIPPGQQVTTISVPTVLAVYDWPKDTDRYKRLVRVVDYLFDRFEKLQKEPGYHEKWKDVNLAASVPGWQRFKPLQEKLDKLAAATHTANTAQARAPAALAAPNDPAEQERMFQRFLEWNKQTRR
jgi:TRAP-type uncharacterized transport system substrate-binding protein